MSKRSKPHGNWVLDCGHLGDPARYGGKCNKRKLLELQGKADDVSGKGKRTPEEVAAELRELTREANGILKDYRHARKEAVETIADRFREELDAAVKEVNQTLLEDCRRCQHEAQTFYREFGERMVRRLAEVFAMAGGDSRRVKLAVNVLRGQTHDAKGVEVDGARYHLLRERADDRGGVTFDFPGGLAERVRNSPELDNLINEEIQKFHPGYELYDIKDGRMERRDP